VKPLTHHEILTLVGPFAAAGYRVDLVGSDREKRELAFRPLLHEGAAVLRDGAAMVRDGPGVLRDGPAVLHDGSATGPGSFTETLRLSLPRPGRVHLVRTLRTELDEGSNGDQVLEADAEVWADGVDDAWRAISTFPLHVHFVREGAILVAFSYALEPPSAAGSPATGGVAGPDPGTHPDAGAAPGTHPEHHLVKAEARIGERAVIMDATRTPGMPADLRLLAHPQGDAEFPDDLVAVLGRAWRPLLSTDQGWKTTVKLPRREPRRSEVARERFLRTVDHLAGCWAETPAHFHRRFVGQRWNVFRRRTIWMQIGAVTLAILFWMFQQEEIAAGGLLPLWVNSIPLLLLIGAFFFWSWDVPLLEFPPIPREPRAQGWNARP